MTRVFTIFDLLWFLLSLVGNIIVAMARSRHNILGILLCACVLIFALTVFLSYKCVQISKLRNPYILEDLSYQSQDLYNSMANSNLKSALLNNMPPLTVHYMWCLKSHFEFKHYLSLLSVAKILKPDQIVFHYLEKPQIDGNGYFTWFDDIQRHVAMISLKPLHNVKHCSHLFSKGVQMSEDFPNNDGIFMTEDIAITNISREDFYRLTDAGKLFSSSTRCEDNDQDVCEKSERRAAQMFLVPSSEPYSLQPGHGRAVIECPAISTFNKANSSTCVLLSQRLFPSDLWQHNKTFDRFARRIVYNTPGFVKPLPNPDLSAPKIAHILKFDEEDGLSPLCFASIKSAFTQGRVQHVFVHGHGDGFGQDPLWKQLVGTFSLVHIPTPGLEGYKATPRKQLLYGMQLLLQYGGILFTCNTILQKPVDPLLHYPSVSTVKKSIYRIIHHHVDFSVLVARPASLYLQNLIPVIKHLAEADSHQDFEAVAYHVYEQYPFSVQMDTNLVGHLTCKSSKCLPSEGQFNVQQAYAVKFAWKEGSPPSSLLGLSALFTPLQSFSLLVGSPAKSS